MELEQAIKSSNLTINKKNILFQETMKKYTTFKVGGNAECLIKIEKTEQIKEILKFANDNRIPITIIGNGSNILVLDKGIKGIVLILKTENVEIKGNQVLVDAGCKIGKLAHILTKNELKGFEEFSGIPGTIGGAITMNAGAHKKEIKDIIKNVICMDYNGKIKKLNKEDLQFGYRTSIFKKEKYIILEAELELKKGKKEEIKEKMQQYLEYRKENQPIEFPSAGSTFKRGNEFITAKLIDDAGLKGYKIGDAEVSTKHSGFIINKGNATAKDILELIEYVKRTIKEKFDKNIELEIEIMGEE